MHLDLCIQIFIYFRLINQTFFILFPWKTHEDFNKNIYIYYKFNESLFRDSHGESLTKNFPFCLVQ